MLKKWVILGLGTYIRMDYHCGRRGLASISGVGYWQHGTTNRSSFSGHALPLDTYTTFLSHRRTNRTQEMTKTSNLNQTRTRLEAQDVTQFMIDWSKEVSLGILRHVLSPPAAFGPGRWDVQLLRYDLDRRGLIHSIYNHELSKTYHDWKDLTILKDR